MGYKVNPANLGAVFVVPTQVVDKHIKLATGQQLKLLLWMLRHSNEGFDMDRLCKDLNFNRDDALDYIQYWVETGVVLCDDCEEENKQAQKEQVQQSETSIPTQQVKVQSVNTLIGKKIYPEVSHSKPTREEILLRAEESDDIKFLLRESQAMLGRTVGYDGQCTLLMIHDTYGIPVEVILMIIEYAVSIGKSNFHYILAMGREWGESEIDTIEKADEKIRTLRSVNSLWIEFAKMAGLSNPRPTRSQEKMLETWTKTWKFGLDMIYFAYEKMTNNCRNLSFAYMNKILESWYNDSIRSVSQVEAYEKGKKSFDVQNKPFSGNKQAQECKNNKPNKPIDTGASYDLEKFKYEAVHQPLVYNKKKKNP